MRNKEKSKWIFINACFVAVLLIVITPLLMVAQYNYPSADDWSYGEKTYQAIQNGAGLFSVLKTSFHVAVQQYTVWEGRYSNAFLASIQPGIWGEEYYGIVTWIMLGGLIVGEWYLCRKALNLNHNKNKWFCIPIIIPTLIMQILYTPSIVESFFWYTGSVNYTFMFGLSMVLMALFLKLAFEDVKGWKKSITIMGVCLLTVLIGGNNFSTSLSTLLAMVTLSVLFFVFNRKGFWRTWYITLLMIISFAVCMLAPAHTVRLEGNFGGTTTGNVVGTIALSLVRSFTNIYSWTNWKIVLMIILILPFVLSAVKNIDYSFRMPGIFTILTFGFYASQIAPNMYVEGTTGGGRMAAILYYSYHMWLVGNVCYWMGWLYHGRYKWLTSIKKRVKDTCAYVQRFLVPYCAVIGFGLIVGIYLSDLKEVSAYKAYRDWRQGWAKQYAQEWEDRLVILRDERVMQVEFAPLSVYPETILYTDLQKEDGYTWLNNACASYYGKESIVVVEPTELQGK